MKYTEAKDDGTVASLSPRRESGLKLIVFGGYTAKEASLPSQGADEIRLKDLQIMKAADLSLCRERSAALLQIVVAAHLTAV